MLLTCAAATLVNCNGETPKRPPQLGTPNTHPIAHLALPPTAWAGATVTSDASASFDETYGIATFAFDFGDGTPVLVLPEPVATHVFDQAGTYEVKVVVTDRGRLTHAASATIQVTGLALSEPVNVSNSAGRSQYEGLSLAPDALYVVWQEQGSIVQVSRSTDGGVTFSTPVTVLPFHPDFEDSQPFIVGLAGGVVHVVWTMFDVIWGGAEVFYANSADGGATFSSARMLSSNDGINSTAPSAGASDSVVLAAWDDVDFDTGPDGAKVTRSADGGHTFGLPSRLSPNPQSYAPLVALVGDNAFIAWAERSPGATLPGLVMFRRSTDIGVSFDPPITLSHGPGPCGGPEVAVHPLGEVEVLWNDGVDAKPFFARSTDGGGIFDPPRPVAALPGPALCPSLALDSAGNIYVSWTIGDYQTHTMETFVAHSQDGGQTFRWQRITRIKGHAGCPRLAARGAGRVAIVWHDDPEPGNWPDILYAEATLLLPN